ncbi:sugar ABC transporter substrate-binding protein [Bacillus timonensis]|uniref:Sugar ABC transporter substrate-binding protein n=1 Tax=Bacillus timonensis TaxID=1033734 RepID=A0A4S3PNV1_9BACI|nr:sugar ABC transporter substrate-binding protein [Bacillus timonensis]THE10835.1 sugar ABC transporter substrate-binding protein [Bacillus timonensis]
MSRLLYLGLTMFMVISIVLMGCSGGDKEVNSKGDSEASNGTNEAQEMTFWTFQGLHIDFFEDANKRWNEANPDRQIKLKLESFPYDEMHNNLLLALQSGVGAPDIVDIEVNRFPNFLQGDIQLEPLNDIIEPEIDSFVKSRFEIYGKDGQYYGAPTHVGASVAFYNKEIFEEAGVNPDDIKTYDDFVEIGKVIKSETGKPMLPIFTNGFWEFYPMISQHDSDFFNSKGEVTLDNEENEEVLQYLYDLIYKHEIGVLAPGGHHEDEEFFAFMNDGGAASLIMPSWYASRFVSYMPDLAGKMVIKPMPAWEEGGNRSAGMGGTGTAVTKQAKDVELAKEFLAFAKLSKESNIRIYELLGFDPPRHDVWDSPQLREPNEFTAYFGDGLFDMLIGVKDEINPLNITKLTPLARDLIETNVLHNTLREKTQTPAEALKQAADELRSR